MLYNPIFLEKLYKEQTQQKYAKIYLLDWNERPIKNLEGEITNGTISIDGDSSIRTTINLSMVSKTIDFTKYNIALQSKIRIDLGLKNNIDNNYSDIIWLQMGIFIVTGFNTSISLSQSTLSISGKDKMCLLNGEISGQIPATTDFGQIDTYENVYSPISISNYSPGKYYYIKEIEDKDVYFLDYSKTPTHDQYYERISTVTTTKLNIKDIIYSMVYIWGHEGKNKIIINDLDIMGNELLEYRGKTPIYFIKEKNTDSNIFLNLIFDPDYMINGRKISELNEEEYYSLNPINNSFQDPYTFMLDGKEYVIVKIKYGETIGYKPTELVFAGELIAAPGESVVTILEKIKNMLGNFEYFYDAYGNFIFQAKHTYQAVDYTKFLVDGNGEVYLNGSPYNNKTIYSFDDTETFTSITHTPNLANLRNDYSIWGEFTSSSGVKKQIHLRYGIEKKPETYYTIGDGPRSGILYKTNGTDQEIEISNNYLNSIYDKFIKVQELQLQYLQQSEENQKMRQSQINFAKNQMLLSLLEFFNKHFFIQLPNNEFLNPKDLENNFIEKQYKVRTVLNTDWINSFAKKYTLLAKEIYQKFQNILLLMFQDLNNGKVTSHSLQDTFDNYKSWAGYKNKVTDYNDNIYAKFMMGTFLNIEIEGNWADFSTSYENNYSNREVACYYGYINSIVYFNTLISQLEEQLKVQTINKDYSDILNNLMNLWQSKIYLLYLETVCGISRTIKDENMTTAPEDLDYNYYKTGIGYNYGIKNDPYYNKFIKSDPESEKPSPGEIFYNDWCFINYTEQGNFSDNIYQLIYQIDWFIKNINNNQQETAEQLHDLEEEYYLYFMNMKNEIKNNNIALIVDWRELIYQMARDFYDYGENSKYNYISMLLDTNKTLLKDNFTLGYEPFYTDMISNWRSLYFNPILEDYEYNIKEATGNYLSDYDKDNSWIQLLRLAPNEISFWFDLTEGQLELNEFSISKIGDRLKTVKDTSIKSLFYKDTPNIIYYNNKNTEYITTENYNINSYSYFWLGGELENLYVLSTQGKSAFDKLQELLYKFTYCAENININALPIYTLQPNYRIQVQSHIAGFTGEYIINKITIPLTYNSTMSINITKAIPYLGIYENR